MYDGDLAYRQPLTGTGDGVGGVGAGVGGVGAGVGGVGVHVVDCNIHVLDFGSQQQCQDGFLSKPTQSVCEQS